jgi:hypothetical protein
MPKGKRYQRGVEDISSYKGANFAEFSEPRGMQDPAAGGYAKTDRRGQDFIVDLVVD